jgi:hypothetical protein
MAYRKEHDRLIFKFNGGRGAILCSNCFCIVYEGSKIPDEYKDVMFNEHNMFNENEQQDKFEQPVFCCEDCKREWFESKK